MIRRKENGVWTGDPEDVADAFFDMPDSVKKEAKGATEFEAQMQSVIDERWNHRNALRVRENTPEVLREVGLADLPMLLTGRHLLSALGNPAASAHPHNIAPEVMAALPKLLENPILIADSERRPDGIVLLTREKDQSGRPIIAAVSTGGRGTLDGKPVECNFVTSVYGAVNIRHWLHGAIGQASVLYIDKPALSEYLDPAYLEAMYPGDLCLHVRGSHNVQSFDLTADDAPARYFIDMDGTLAQFHAEENYLERMTEPGFFESLLPYEKMIDKLKSYKKAHPDSEFFVLSGLTADAPDCEGQKNRWLDKYLPEIDAGHRIFTENGDDKSLYIPGGVHARDILIDDYNKNLEDWLAAGGAAVKFVNSVNDRALRSKRWEGDRIRYDHPEDVPQILGRLSANRSSKDVLQKELQKRVAEIAMGFRDDPAKIAEYLEFAARFRSYSAKNVRLILAQRPDARYIAPAKLFVAGLPDKEGNRLVDDPIYIKKGEKALYIWKPCSVAQVQIGGHWKSTSELKPDEWKLYKAGELPARQTNRFTLVPVFDVTQTTLPPEIYPRLFGFGSPSRSADELAEAISAYAQNELKCPVTTEDFKGAATSVKGAFFPDLNCIKLSSMLSGEERLSTLIHELGHASLHANRASSGEKSTARIELEADLYALMIGQHLGLKITDSRKAHLAEHYKTWLSELPEADRADVNADMPVFGDVCRRYRETVDRIDEYAERYAVYHQAETEQLAVAEEAEEEKFDLQTDQPKSEQGEQAENQPKKTWNITV